MAAEKEGLMVDDAIAKANWRVLFQHHVTVIAKQRGIPMPRGWEFMLPDTPVTEAIVQAYHEGAEGFRKRGH